MDFRGSRIFSALLKSKRYIKTLPLVLSLIFFLAIISQFGDYCGALPGGFVTNQYFVAVIGAGPAGLFGARELANKGARVLLLNRDIKPGGLAEYGIYPNKYIMKGGLRKQFRQIIDLPNLDYYGNITVGSQGDLSLDDLRALGVQAILVTVGAQGTKWLGLPGEELEGVYHAKDVVYYYNHLPPFMMYLLG
jgi:NADPH-dependent glutamate synthase beta subunit-like oxidoreductase